MNDRIIKTNHSLIRQLTNGNGEPNSPEECCGTSYAAKLQSLVEKKELNGWKTQGGHRRISLKSLNEYVKKNNYSNNEPDDKILRVLIVEDDSITRDILRGYCERAKLPVDCTAMSSGMEALLDISSLKPDLLITDLDMPGIDGFELLRIIRNNPKFENMLILVLSAMTLDEIKTHGELPKDSMIMNKPVKAEWFDGFFAGVILRENLKSAHNFQY
jgi:CheY-like chemotaxis protein